MRKLCTGEIGGVKVKNKMHFVIFGCSFGFKFQRWFVELEKAFL
jgi:hypothetical protein